MNPYQVVKDFERALCEYTGAPYAVTTTSCTMALLLAVAWHLRNKEGGRIKEVLTSTGHHAMAWQEDGRTVEIPKRTYVGVPMSIIHAGGRPTFRDEGWRGLYQLRPLPVWDSARWFSSRMYLGAPRRLSGDIIRYGQQTDIVENYSGGMLCVSFHWSKTLGIQQGGAILHDSPEADHWLRQARFDGRVEGESPADQAASLTGFNVLGWHCYMSPETAAAGLVRLANLPRNNEPLPWGPGTSSDYPDLSQMDIFR